MNIDNLNKLIAHLEAQPPERFNMHHVFTDSNGFGSLVVLDIHQCGTAACIAGHCVLLAGHRIGEVRGAYCAADWLGVNYKIAAVLFEPKGYAYPSNAFTISRAIGTLKRLRDTYLSTGQVAVDWGPEPGEEPKRVWTAPQVAEVINPALPAELTSLLRNTVEA